MFEAYGYALVPVIVALVGILRRTGVPVRFLPLISVVLGIAAGLVYTSPDNPKQAVLEGMIMGLSAVGLYSGVKNTMTKSSLPPDPK